MSHELDHELEKMREDARKKLAQEARLDAALERQIESFESKPEPELPAPTREESVSRPLETAKAVAKGLKVTKKARDVSIMTKVILGVALGIVGLMILGKILFPLIWLAIILAVLAAVANVIVWMMSDGNDDDDERDDDDA